MSLIDNIPSLISPPVSKADKTNALIFDSFFDSYRGVVASVRVFGKSIGSNQKLKLVNSKYEFEPTEIGYFDLGFNKTDVLNVGEVGYIITGAKDLSQIRVGDTLVEAADENPLLYLAIKNLNQQFFQVFFH